MNLRLPRLRLILLLGARLALRSPLCWAQGSRGATPTVVLTNPFCQMAPGSALHFFRDPSRHATLLQVLAKPPGEWSEFKPGPPTSFGFTGDIFWLRLRLRSALAERGDAVVELHNPRLEKVDWFALRHGEAAQAETI